MTDQVETVRTEQREDDLLLVFENCRVFFPNFWEPGWNKKYDKSDGYGCKLTFSKQNQANVKVVKRYLVDVAKSYEMRFTKQTKHPLTDGDDRDSEITHGHWEVRLRSQKYAPIVFDAEMRRVRQAEDGVATAGCRCDVVARGWANEEHNVVGLNPLYVRHVSDEEALEVGTGGTVEEAAEVFGRSFAGDRPAPLAERGAAEAAEEAAFPGRPERPRGPRKADPQSAAFPFDDELPL